MVYQERGVSVYTLSCRSRGPHTSEFRPSVWCQAIVSRRAISPTISKSMLTHASRRQMVMQMRSPTYNCTATRRLTPSCGVYDGLRQALSLFAALGCLTLAKTAWRRLIPVLDVFFWHRAAFARLYRLYTDASSIIYLYRLLYRCWLQNTCTNVYHSSMARWNYSDRYRVPVLTARRGNCVRREGEKHRLTGSRKK